MFKVGDTVQTRDGEYIGRVLCTDFRSESTLVCAMKKPSSAHEYVFYRKVDGLAATLPSFSGPHPMDIVPVPVVETKYYHLYSDNSLGKADGMNPPHHSVIDRFKGYVVLDFVDDDYKASRFIPYDQKLS